MKLKKVVAPVAAAAFLVVATVVPSHALFVAYDDANFRGAELVRISSGAPAVIDVADDRTSSIKNFSGKGYSARSIVGPYVSHEVYIVPNNASISYLGSANDVIDHFDVRG